MLLDQYLKGIVLDPSKYLFSAPGRLKVKDRVKMALGEEELAFYLMFQLPFVYTY